MQLSAANLLIAAQQAAKASPAPRPDGSAFAAALAKEATPFEPLPFKTAPAAEQPSQPSSAPAPTAAAPKGSQVDIRV